MNKKLNLLLLAFIAAFILSACSGKSDEQKAESTPDAKTASSEPTKARKYPFEKGIVYQQQEAMGMEMPTVIYVDKWGEWECTETSMKMMGVSITNRKIIKGDDVWELNLEEKTGTHYKQSQPVGYAGMDLDKINMDNLTDEAKKMMENMKMEVVGKEEYLGYKCNKIIMKTKGKDDKLKISSEMLMCGNMPMKMKGEAMGIGTSMEVTKIEKTAPPADKFEVPTDIKIEEVK